MNQYSKTIDARLKAFSFVFIVMIFILLWRLLNIGVLQHDHYLALAQGQQRFEKTEMPSRGKILVHDSSIDPKSYYPLAFDVKKFAVWVIPHQISDKKKVADSLSSLVGIKSDEIFDKINNDKLYIPPLKRGLVLDEANKIIDKKINGVLVVPEYSRFYPEGSLASHLLGFVNNDGDGMYGFEGRYNDVLKGKEGNVVGEKDTLGRMISLLEQKDPQDGVSYVLTVDRSVQYFVEKKLTEALEKYQADSGSVLIMDVKTGGIVAMASVPTFDPNNFREQADSNPGIFVNPAISHLYEPGSVFKTLSMASALDAGVVTPETEGTFSNMTVVDGYEIHTAEDKPFGTENMAQILQNSDNVGMVWVADKLGSDKLYDYVKKFGLINKTGIDLDTEVPGNTYPLKQWRNITRATVSFGQGISVTPIELLTAYATIANNGKYIYPHMIDKMVFPDGTEKKVEKQEGEQVISEKTAKIVAEMLFSVVENGHSKKAAVPGFKVGAKTGTAQIVGPNGYEKNETGLGIYNHTLAGFAPTDDPRFTMIVKLERPKSAKYAESTAAPLFGEIASFLLNYHYRIAPTEQIK
jgi:cell division protein FtsI/penicillin-binding protein 2